MRLTSNVQLALGPKVIKLLCFDMMVIVGIEGGRLMKGEKLFDKRLGME